MFDVGSALVALVMSGAPPAQTPAVASHADPAPAEIAAAIRPLLADGGTRVTVGAVTIDFWWVKAVALARPPAGRPAWTHVAEGTLVGAARLSAASRDIRGRTIRPGVYTLRFALQPQNGDHLGASPYREFLLLAAAALDTDPAPRGHDDAVRVSGETIGVAHPAPLSLDPPLADADVGSVLKNEEFELTSVVFEVPAAHGGQPAGAIRFGLVVVGRIDA